MRRARRRACRWCCEAAIVLSTARPSAPPTRRERVEQRPRPARCRAAARPGRRRWSPDTSAEAQADRGEQAAGQHVGDVARRPACTSDSSARPAAASSMPAASTRPDAEAGDERGVCAVTATMPSVIGRKARPVSQRVVAEHLLQVQRDEEPHREDGGEEQEDDEVGRAQPARAEDRQRASSGASAKRPSTSAKAASSARPTRDRHEHAGRAPAAACRCARSRRRAPMRPSGDEHRAGDVEVAVARARRGPRGRRAGQRDHREPDGHVDEEDRGPAEALREQRRRAARRRRRRRRPSRPTRRARGCARAPSVNEVVRIARLAGEMIAPPKPCSARAPTSSAARVGQRAGQRGEREQRGAGQEHAPAAEQVGGAAAEQQEAGEGQRVGVDDPLQARGREVRPCADRRQRDVDDRDVEDRP